MLWYFIGHIFSVLLSLIRISCLSENDKDLEIIILGRLPRLIQLLIEVLFSNLVTKLGHLTTAVFEKMTG